MSGSARRRLRRFAAQIETRRARTLVAANDAAKRLRAAAVQLVVGRTGLARELVDAALAAIAKHTRRTTSDRLLAACVVEHVGLDGFTARRVVATLRALERECRAARGAS